MSRRCAIRLLTPCVVVVTLALAGCGETGGDPTALPAATTTATATPPPAEEMPPAPTNAPPASPPIPRASPPS